jgi:hypothetical protein
MSHIVRDSFAPYLTLADANGLWTSANAANIAMSSTTRFGVGQSMVVTAATGSGVALTIIAPRNQATQFVGFAFLDSGSIAGTAFLYEFVWSDGSTVQVTAALRSDGAILFYRGTTSGTLLATYSGAFTSAIWAAFTIEVIIDPTVGEIHVRKDGNSSDDFSATGLNTRASANSYANAMQITWVGNTSSRNSVFLQDVWFWDGDGSGTPNTWQGDFRATQQIPITDTAQIQFTPNAASLALGTATTGTTGTITANVITYNQMPPVPVGGVIATALSLQLNANLTGHMILGIYDSDGASGAPGTLIAQSSPLTNPTTGANVFTLMTSPTLLNGHTYYWAILDDANATLRYSTTLANTFSQYTEAQSYGSGFPATATSLTGPSTGRTASIAGTMASITNSGCVQELIEDGTNTYVADANVGDYDLYEIMPMAASPSSILGVSFRLLGNKTDAGARSGAIAGLSGATAFASAAINLSSTLNSQVNLVQDTDPDTGVAWTPTGVNNVQFGPKVAA